MLPTGTLLFQVLQPIISGKDVLVAMDTMKTLFEQLRGKVKPPEEAEDSAWQCTSLEESVNEVVQAVITQEKDLPKKDSSGHMTDEVHYNI